MNPLWMRPSYWNFIRSEAALIDTDGCSHVSGVKAECCFEHDCAYRHHTDPRHAYLLFRQAVEDYWAAARPITREETDRRFWKCHASRSVFGKYSPMAAWRWAGVRLLGRRAWQATTDRAEAAMPGNDDTPAA